MDVKVAVSGPGERYVENEWNIRDQGDLTRAVGEALALYHSTYPDAPPFQHTISIDKA